MTYYKTDWELSNSSFKSYIINDSNIKIGYFVVYLYKDCRDDNMYYDVDYTNLDLSDSAGSKRSQALQDVLKFSLPIYPSFTKKEAMKYADDMFKKYMKLIAFL